MKFVTRGDSTDVFNDDFPHPFGSPWTTHIATEIKNEETTWIMETSGLLSGPVAFAAGESSPIQLAHPIDVKRTVGMLGTRYSVIQFFKGREVFRKYPKFGDSLGNTEDDSTKWIGEALYYIGTTAINDLQEDSTTRLENILAERIENYIRGYVDRKNFTELYSIGDSASLFVDDVLQPFLTQLPANYPAAYQDAVDLYSNEMHITGQLQDDQFKFHIFLPGVIISTNADSIAGDTLLWTFGLKDFLNDDYILEAESIVYSKKRIQFAIIVVTLLVLIIAVILIKFKR
tara:strand:+ start:2627 stop:3490 length:864 start_codon:yes stop_codon:yes gene_type:complete